MELLIVHNANTNVKLAKIQQNAFLVLVHIDNLGIQIIYAGKIENSNIISCLDGFYDNGVINCVVC